MSNSTLSADFKGPFENLGVTYRDFLSTGVNSTSAQFKLSNVTTDLNIANAIDALVADLAQDKSSKLAAISPISGSLSENIAALLNLASPSSETLSEYLKSSFGNILQVGQELASVSQQNISQLLQTALSSNNELFGITEFLRRTFGNVEVKHLQESLLHYSLLSSTNPSSMNYVGSPLQSTQSNLLQSEFHASTLPMVDISQPSGPISMQNFFSETTRLASHGIRTKTEHRNLPTAARLLPYEKRKFNQEKAAPGDSLQQQVRSFLQRLLDRVLKHLGQ